MMDWKKYIRSVGIIAPALVIIGGVSPQLLRAQLAGEWLVSLEFPPTEDVGQTSRTIGQGTRKASDCIEGETPLTALMPTRNNVGTTVSANPSMFWYVPKTIAQEAEFVVWDENNEEVYQTTFAISGTPGIVKVKLPEEAALSKGKTYQWGLYLICNPEDRGGDEFVEGKIKRTELSAGMKTKLARTTPLEQANIYAKAGIWNETLDIAAQLRPSNPQAWEELLKSVKLEAIASEPFAECCTAVEN